MFKGLLNKMVKRPVHSYVAGFCFDTDAEHVLLIKKSKPKWQRDKLNGVGGKIEKNESPIEAMIREFTEETGIVNPIWRRVAILEGKNRHSERWVCHFFKSFISLQTLQLPDGKSVEGEGELQVVKVDDIHMLPVIPNLKWLIPFTLCDYDAVPVLTEQTQGGRK